MIKCFIALALLIGLFAGAALGEDTVFVDLNTYQWKNRLLLLFASSEEDQAYLTLNKEIDRQAMEIKDRDLLVFYVLERGESRSGQERLSSGQALFLRKRLSVPSGRFTIILIGKDGGEKIRRESSVDLKEIFAIIDAMPMRQQEMKKNGRTNLSWRPFRSYLCFGEQSEV
jgi:hypothetical protein